MAFEILLSFYVKYPPRVFRKHHMIFSCQISSKGFRNSFFSFSLKVVQTWSLLLWDGEPSIPPMEMAWRYTHIQEGNDMNTIYQINCNWQWWDKHISIINMWIPKRISCKSNQPTCEFIDKIIAKDTSCHDRNP